jgi:hypothetical protein
VVEERRLVEVLSSTEFGSPGALLALLPDDMPNPFTTRDLATGLKRTRHLAQEVAYCLREAGVIKSVGRDRRGHLYGLPPQRSG